MGELSFSVPLKLPAKCSKGSTIKTFASLAHKSNSSNKCCLKLHSPIVLH